MQDKEEYIERINKAMQDCDDMPLLDLIMKLLDASPTECCKDIISDGRSQCH